MIAIVGEVAACADCGTAGGYRRHGHQRPARYRGEQFDFDGELCHACYCRHAVRRSRAANCLPGDDRVPFPQNGPTPDVIYERAERVRLLRRSEAERARADGYTPEWIAEHRARVRRTAGLAAESLRAAQEAALAAGRIRTKQGIEPANLAAFKGRLGRQFGRRRGYSQAQVPPTLRGKRGAA